MEFQQSKTYANLQNANERELMISTLYDIFGDQAVAEQYIQISNIFRMIERNNKEHARIFLRRLNNGVIPDTQANLLSSANFETDTAALYRDYANTAKDENYNDIAASFNGIANISLNHDLFLRTQYDNIIRQEVFCKPQQTLWICQQCGNILAGDCAPTICPICGFPQGYYMVYAGAET
jgi:rubrerythrin